MKHLCSFCAGNMYGEWRRHPFTGPIKSINLTWILEKENIEQTLLNSQCFCRFQDSLFQLELVDPFLVLWSTRGGGISKTLAVSLVQAAFFPVHLLLFDKEQSRITTRLSHYYCYSFKDKWQEVQASCFQLFGDNFLWRSFNVSCK